MPCPNKLNSNNFEIYYVEQTGQYWCDGATVIPANPVFTRIDTDGGTPITNVEASKSKSLMVLVNTLISVSSLSKSLTQWQLSSNTASMTSS